MPTNTELINAALRKAGARRVPDANSTVGSAGIAADVLATERSDMLRKGAWNFATTRALLAALTSAPVFEFQYAFALPDDYVRTISVSDNSAGDGVVPYKLESVKQPDNTYVPAILSDSNVIYLRYIRDVVDPNQMTADFRDLLILRMAKIFAVGVAASSSLRAAIDADLDKAVRETRSIDGIEDYPDRMPEGSWATSRRARGWMRDTGWPR